MTTMHWIWAYIHHNKAWLAAHIPVEAPGLEMVYWLLCVQNNFQMAIMNNIDIIEMWFEIINVYRCASILGAKTSAGTMVAHLWSHLTRWGWVMHICVSKLSILGSDNGLSPGRRQAII